MPILFKTSNDSNDPSYMNNEENNNSMNNRQQQYANNSSANNEIGDKTYSNSSLHLVREGTNNNNNFQSETLSNRNEGVSNIRRCSNNRPTGSVSFLEEEEDELEEDDELLLSLKKEYLYNSGNRESENNLNRN